MPIGNITSDRTEQYLPLNRVTVCRTPAAWLLQGVRYADAGIADRERLGVARDEQHRMNLG
jgi:hypothetical protein